MSNPAYNATHRRLHLIEQIRLFRTPSLTILRILGISREAASGHLTTLGGDIPLNVVSMSRINTIK